MKDILPSYFGSEWSFAQFHVSASKSICCFGADRFTIIGNLFAFWSSNVSSVVTMDGTYFRYVYQIESTGEFTVRTDVEYKMFPALP